MSLKTAQDLTQPSIRTDGLCASRTQTLLERGLPFRELSLLALAERRAPDPVYGAHRWWARRPPSVMRGLLLAAALPADTSASTFWKLFATDEPLLEGFTVHDLFVGGGTTLVEAARLGATPSGTDVDPLAVEITRHELERPDQMELRAAGKAMLAHIRRRVGHLYASPLKKWTPLHYFFLHQVCCPSCHSVSALYRNLIIARDTGKTGAVVRDATVVAFCPDCFSLHFLGSADRLELRCCGRRHQLSEGSFAGQRFECNSCGARFSHKQLQTATLPRRLLAVEETAKDRRRRIRAPKSGDKRPLDLSVNYRRRKAASLSYPEQDLKGRRIDTRPLSFGIRSPKDFFSDRQLAVFGVGFRWLEDADYEPSIRRALALALSNTMTTNNRLCGYATDYGRLAPLFNVRGYSLPLLSVELNPFHETAGRGTLAAGLRRVIQSAAPHCRRYVWNVATRATEFVAMTFPTTRKSRVACASATSGFGARAKSVDICLFDPPYFDYIAYSELSEFYRPWLGKRRLGGRPLLPEPEDPAGSFERRLAECLQVAEGKLKTGRPLAFTFHSALPQAWQAVGKALDTARLLVTALWPLKNDANMGHHTYSGNCEWDVVVVCRRQSECTRTRRGFPSLEEWMRRVRPLEVTAIDQKNLGCALEMASSRFGAPQTTRRQAGGGPQR